MLLIVNSLPFTIHGSLFTNFIELDESLKDSFDIISSFNIEARYPDYKKEFYKKCSNEFTAEQMLKIKDIRSLLLKQLQK